MGKHAAPGYGRLTRELSSFVLRLLIVAALFFGAIWLGVTYLPDLIGGDDEAAGPTTAAPTTSTMAETTTSVLATTVPTTLPPPPTTTTTTTLPATTTTTLPPERPAGDVEVLVLNSTGRSGLAATATAVLDGLGYQTLEPDNSTPALAVTQVLFAPGFAAEAYTLAAQFPDGEVLVNPSGEPAADIVVVLGTSYVP